MGEADFELAAETRALASTSSGIGGLVSFIGLMRDHNEGRRISSLYLEHYPAMTEKALTTIASQASERWSLEAVTIIHRVGELYPGDQIVLVLTAAPHRAEAFAACEFIMDYLKTRAPFWKKERTDRGEHWVEARRGDDEAAGRW